MESNNGPVDFERAWSVIQLLYNNHDTKAPSSFIMIHSYMISFITL